MTLDELKNSAEFYARIDKRISTNHVGILGLFTKSIGGYPAISKSANS